MTRTNATYYTHTHTKINDAETVHLSLSNARDIYGNEVVSTPSSGGTITVSVPDRTDPVITAPADRTVEAKGYRTPVALGTPIVSDNKDPNPRITNNAPPSGFLVKTTTVTWTARDASGNTAIDTQRITVRDTTPPTITGLSDMTVEATALRTPVDIGTPTVSDAVDPSPTVTSSPTRTLFPVEVTTITWTARDASGNTATATQRITVQDTTPPDITAPRDVSFTTPDASIALTKSHYGTATARDLVDSTPTIRNNAPTLFDSGRTTTITWTATDDYRNSDTATQRVTVIHSSLAITAPADVTVEATAYSTPVNIGTANATHDTDTDLTISNNATATSFPVGATTILWTVVDSSGVTATATQRITVQDTTDPTLAPVQDLDFVFEPDVPIMITYDSPAATDIADASVTVSCTPASGTVFAEGATEVACTATDDSGNTDSSTFNVNVLVFSTTIFFDDFEDGNMDGWTVTYYHDTWAAVPLEENAYPPDHPATNKVAQAVFCDVACSMNMSGIDLSGHGDPEFLQFYRYVDDSLDAGSYLKFEIYDGTSWVQLDRWTPENSDHDDTWHLEEYSLANYTGVTDFGVRFTAYMDSFRDVVGIDDVRIFIVPEPAMAPTITAPADVTAEATGTLTAVNIGTATTSGGNATVTNDAPASFPLGNTTVTWTATISSNESATDTQIITVQDTTPPSVTAPPDASFATTDTSLSLTASDYGTATATDLVDSSPVITSNAQASFPIGITTITWTATDDHANSATAAQNVTVIRSSLAITPPADVTAEAAGPLTAVDIGNATATHDTDTNITIRNDAPASFPLGNTTVTWTATDSSSVSVTATQTVTVQDTTDPAFGTIQDLDFVFEPDVPIVINYDSPAAADSVDASVAVVCTPASGTAFVEGATEVTCTATDDSGNTANTTFDVNVLVFSTTIFLDDFEDGNMDGWTVTDYVDTWAAYVFEDDAYPPDHPVTNKVAQVVWCDITCSMNMSGIDLSGHDDPEFLQFYRYVGDSLDAGAYLALEVYNGTSWVQLDRWTPENSDHDDTWHLEEYSLANYTGVTDFGVRFTAYLDAANELVGLDDVKIFKVPGAASNSTALAITAPADATAEATGTLTAVNIGTATTSGGNATITNDAPASFPLGNTTILWTATGPSNNTATDTQIITVQDTTAPTITAPADASFNATGTSLSLTASDYGTATATDLVDSSPVITSNAPASFPVGTTIITWTATDDYLNSANVTQRVTVVQSPS